MKYLLIICSSIGFRLIAAEPSVVTITLPQETATYRSLPGVEHAQAYCITCHSVEYTSSQPPLPRAYWEGAVKKMKEKFGAPLPPDTSLLVDYLTRAYGAPEVK